MTSQSYQLTTLTTPYELKFSFKSNNKDRYTVTFNKTPGPQGKNKLIYVDGYQPVDTSAAQYKDIETEITKVQSQRE